MLHQLLPRLGGTVLALAIVCAASPALSESWLTCPEKVLDTATISGIYQGWYEDGEIRRKGGRRTVLFPLPALP